MTLPELSWQYNWQLDYLTDAVKLVVVPTGDFNDDGVVDAADYIVWRKLGGTQAEFNNWQSTFGTIVNGGAGGQSNSYESGNVPEPASALICSPQSQLPH